LISPLDFVRITGQVEEEVGGEATVGITEKEEGTYHTDTTVLSYKPSFLVH